MSTEFRSGVVAIVGRPNAGKSTLLNAVLKSKLSIVSPKAQTTRKRVLGIYNDSDSQILFLDTPGLIKSEYEMQRRMMDYVAKSIEEADLLCLIIDLEKLMEEKQDIAQIYHHEAIWLKENKKNLVLVLNKADRVKDRKQILPIMEDFMQWHPFQAVVPLSAISNEAVDVFISAIKDYMPVHPPYYDQEQLSEQPERFFVEELLRETLYYHYQEEIPYACDVHVEEFKERKNGKDYIRLSIIVERDSQKKIIIGKNGEAIKKLGQRARSEIEKF
jgi:GTP-binding protein Era